MTDCLFCKIAAKEIDSEVVLETDGVLAFRDINPAAPTHVLVIPKAHIASARELSVSDAPLLGELFDAMSQVAASEGLERGYRIVSNIGGEGGQTVGHLHFHLLGGRSMSWPPG
jgi:histidine triad (HIT) family protein